jgi:hypothetical protein
MRISYTPIGAGIGLTGRTLVLTIDGVHTAANGAVTCQFSWRVEEPRAVPRTWLLSRAKTRPGSVAAAGRGLRDARHVLHSVDPNTPLNTTTMAAIHVRPTLIHPTGRGRSSRRRRPPVVGPG